MKQFWSQHLSRVLCNLWGFQEKRFSIKSGHEFLMFFTIFCRALNHKFHAETEQKLKDCSLFRLTAIHSMASVSAIWLSELPNVCYFTSTWCSCNRCHHVWLLRLNDSFASRLFAWTMMEVAKPPIATFTCHRFLISMWLATSFIDWIVWSCKLCEAAKKWNSQLWCDNLCRLFNIVCRRTNFQMFLES